MKLLERIRTLSFPSFKVKRAKNYLALQFGKSFIRLLELGEDEKPIFQPQEIIFEDGDENKKLSALKKIVAEYGLQGHRVIASLPATDGILKLYKYPSKISKKDLDSAIEWRIKSELTQIKEEAIYDYFILHGEDALNLALVLARAESVNRLTNLISSAGLKPEIIDYEVLAIVNYGIYHKLALPFSILYIDYDHSILLTYSPSDISYYVINWDYLRYSKKAGSSSEEPLESFLAEARNLIVINDIPDVYIAGVVLNDQSFLDYILENLPILGLLDAGELPPNFFVPYILSLRERSK
ncbi:MAG: pilus assembly protein PilM [Thermocrinis sp.]|jgi:type IV pilus assembly protein PilM|uniref:pilus assembly protein PilM n=1 Tax=Thermocrinis sp. TaxID=2024383 RepID=UPI003C0EE38A